MTKISKREKLRQMVNEHPEWITSEYARIIGQSPDAVRAALFTMGYRRVNKLYLLVKEPKDYNVKSPKKKEKKLSTEPIFNSSSSRVYSSTRVSSSVGYTKLI